MRAPAERDLAVINLQPSEAFYEFVRFDAFTDFLRDYQAFQGDQRMPCPAGATPADNLLAGAVTSPSELIGRFPEARDELLQAVTVADVYPMLISRYYLNLFTHPGDPLWKQAVPAAAELCDGEGYEDPLAEDLLSPVPAVTHRYPDRVLFLVSGRCALHCRFCTRKRKTGRTAAFSSASVAEGLAYIRDQRRIRDVLISGGDPLLLEDDRLQWILSRLRALKHVEIIRIGTRVPCVLPERVTQRLAGLLAQYQPLYINTHFNHPREVTDQAAKACGLLSDAGIPLGCQTVLLRGVNDSAPVMRDLLRRLLQIRVRPYYLHQMDLTRGTAHFRTSLQAGIDMLESLQGHVSGMCIPHFVVDLPGGGGKVPLTPEYIVGREHGDLLVKNYQGDVFRYRLLPDEKRDSAS